MLKVSIVLRSFIFSLTELNATHCSSLKRISRVCFGYLDTWGFHFLKALTTETKLKRGCRKPIRVGAK